MPAAQSRCAFICEIRVIGGLVLAKSLVPNSSGLVSCLRRNDLMD